MHLNSGKKPPVKTDKENKMMYSSPLCKFVFMSPKGNYLTTDSNKPLSRLGWFPLSVYSSPRLVLKRERERKILTRCLYINNAKLALKIDDDIIVSICRLFCSQIISLNQSLIAVYTVKKWNWSIFKSKITQMVSDTHLKNRMPFLKDEAKH